MTPQLAPIGSAILSLAWQGESGLTYTIQTSGDLAQWSTLPYVVEGDGTNESYYLEQLDEQLYVRLCYDTDGDTDNNTLPDLWEWQHFDCIGINPDADPDLDGRSNAEEWLLQTDPNDFYDGEWPDIRLSCGTDWLVPAGHVSMQYLSMSLLKASGEPWDHAPVYLEMEDGASSLVCDGGDGQVTSANLLLWTDANGKVSHMPESIHVLASDSGGIINVLRIQAGNAVAQIHVHSIAEAFGPPPRDLTRWNSGGGDLVYSWTGDPNGAESMLIEEKDASGNWNPVLEIAIADLPAADEDSGLYFLTLGDGSPE